MHTAKADRDGSNTVAQRGPDPIRVLPRVVIWLVWAVSGLGVALGVLTFVYAALNHQSLNEILTTMALQAVWAMSFPLVGAVIATHRPRNPLGWMFLFIGLSEGLIIFGYEYATYVFRTAPGAAPGGELAAWVSQSAWAPALGLALCYVPLLFPDGRLPSRRWRPVAWLSAIPITVITVLTAVVAWPWRGPALLDPDGIPQDTSAFDAVFFPAYILMLGCGLAGLPDRAGAPVPTGTRGRTPAAQVAAVRMRSDDHDCFGGAARHQQPVGLRAAARRALLPGPAGGRRDRHLALSAV
jgi:hypothetical protein